MTDPTPWTLVHQPESEDPYMVRSVSGNWVASCATRGAAERIVAAINAHEGARDAP